MNIKLQRRNRPKQNKIRLGRYEKETDGNAGNEKKNYTKL